MTPEELQRLNETGSYSRSDDVYGVVPDLASKIDGLLDRYKEVAFGYNDSGCFWTIHYGLRGAGAGMAIGGVHKFEALDADTFEEAIDAFLRHIDVIDAEPVVPKLESDHG